MPPSKALAGWALGLAIVGCFAVTLVASVAMAIVVLVESRKDARDRGQGMAIAALVINGVWVVVLVLGVVASVVSPPPPSSPENPVDSLTSEDLDRMLPAKLRVGDCFDDKALAGIGIEDDGVQAGLVTRVPCERLHDFEAYDTFRIPGAEFPGRAEVERQAGLGCIKAFKPYVGRAYGPSDLDFWIYYPTATSWALSDHSVTCVVGEPDAKTSGRLRGSGR